MESLSIQERRLTPDNQIKKWPLPEFDESLQPHFLFIITPPNSGSTALAGLLSSSPRTMLLTNNGEGQWLIPGLCEEDRWNPDKAVNYASIKAVWLHVYQKARTLVPTVDTVIEKSPPNMMRLEQLVAQFRDYSLIAINRNPYASCASKLYRYHPAELLNSQQRKIVLTKTATNWLSHSARIRELVLKLKIPLLTYEDFCDAPSTLLSKLDLPPGVAQTIDLDTQVSVKEYPIQRISNQNARQMSYLTHEDIDHISANLERNGALLEFFGYRTMH
jgi:hypothetical protein